MPGINLTIDSRAIEKIEKDLGNGLGLLIDLKETLKKYTLVAQARAVRNVSGTTVVYLGGTFVVNRVTGTLARRFRIVASNALVTTLVNEAEYASHVEQGTRGPTDMKPYLMGKTIRFKDKKTGKYIFRKVTPRSTGWIIPQAKPRPFMAEAGAYVEPLLARAVDQTVRAYFDRIMSP